ncbi:hypothetical protein [Stella humosa]|nr:hypothetical protein [Stella humosa]
MKPVPLAPPPAVTAEPSPDDAADLVRDRPRTLNKLWSASLQAAQWAADLAMSAIDQVAPPSATDFAGDDAQQAGQLFKLLGMAGYKLKEIDNEVGLIPGLAFKFGLVREISQADIDYLDEQMQLHRINFPGVISSVQRSIVSTVVSINNGGGMQVSELKLTLLPLPKAEFSITPSATALSEEHSALMRAIQRVDGRVRDLSRLEVKAAAAAQKR